MSKPIRTGETGRRKSGVAPATAQTAPEIATRTINLTAEQYHIIKENVLKDTPVVRQSDSPTVKLGEGVTATVTLLHVPANVSEKISSLKSHVYYVDNGKVVIVDPKDNSVADIVE